MKQLIRFCPNCGNKIQYKSREACCNGKRKNTSCRSCSTKQQYKNDSNKNKGQKNGRYGKKLIDLFKTKYKSKANSKYEKWRKNLNKFKSGNLNPQFGKKSNIESGISYCGWYKNLFFRSTYELIFILKFEKENNELPESAENLNYFVTYEISGVTRNYFPDFISKTLNSVYEIKPKKYIKNPINKAKFDAAKNHFYKFNIKFLVITEKELNLINWQSYVFQTLYELVLNKQITLTEKSLLKFKTALKNKNMINKLNHI